MNQDIKIMAEPQAVPTQCKFRVDRPVLPDDAVYFPNEQEAQGSPLAEAIFAVGGIQSLLVANDTLTITKFAAEEWPQIGPKIGAAIRAHINSGKPAVDPRIVQTRPSEDEIRERVQNVLETEINPAVAGHGGWVGLIDVRGSTVYLQMGGGCQGCGQADMTLKMGVEQAIRTAVPQVGEILDATDHAAGRNPYYASH